LLVAGGRLDKEDLKRAREVQQETNQGLASVAIKLGFVAEAEMAKAVSSVFDIPVVADKDFPEVPVCEDRLSAKFLKTARALPLEETDAEVVVAMADPEDRFAQQAISLACGKPVSIRIATPTQIERAIIRLYETAQTAIAEISSELQAEDSAESSADIERLKDLASETPVVRLVNTIINRAVEIRASDIHIEPFRTRLKVRYRVDGVLHDTESPPAKSTAAVISRLKIMARLNIAERRRPQDGRIQLRAHGKEIDVRVSTVPTLYGESVVLRILDKEQVTLDFQSLGFDGDTAQQLLETLALPHGIILVTGPTGSGKTTTLYAALQHLNTPDRKILTVEDPVEYQLEGINQIQVKPQIDLTFANALRSIVRQDPDVIMVGEMRDLETATIAVQAALTGHLVLSTLHTNNAGSSVTRLLDMGVEGFLLTSTVNGILAQRLVRKLCKKCRRSKEAFPEHVQELELYRYTNEPRIYLYSPVGCEECGGTGYKGRTAVIEYLLMTDPIRRLVLSHADGTAIQKAAVENGMPTMKDDGMRKALAGITTIEEVLRVTQES